MGLLKDVESQYTTEKQVIEEIIQLFPQFKIEDEVLLNWEVDLVESMDKYGIEEAIASIVHYDSDTELTSCGCSIDSVLKMISKHIQDGDEFAGLVLEVLSSILSHSLVARIENHASIVLLVDLYMNILNSNTKDETGGTFNSLRKLILVLMESGCDVETYQKLVFPLYKSSNAQLRIEVIDFLTQILEKYPTPHPFLLTNHQINFPFPNAINKCFSVYCWVRLSTRNSDSNNFAIVTLSNSDSLTSTNFVLRIVNGNQFMVELRNPGTKSRSQFTFNHIMNEMMEEPFQIAITYDQKTNLNLYINGEILESIPCAGLHKDSACWNKISIGETDCGLIVRNISLLNVSLSDEVIEYLFCLGSGSNIQVENLNEALLPGLKTQLSHASLSTFARNYLSKTKTESNSGPQKTKFVGKSSYKNGKGESDDLSVNFFHRLSKGISSSPITEKNVLFDSNDVFNDISRRASSQIGIGTKVIFCNPTSVFRHIYVFGTLPWLLKILEDACKLHDEVLRDTLFLKTLSLLFKLLNDDWRLSKEFEQDNGYNILGLILFQYKIANPNLTFHLDKFSEEDVGIESSGCHSLNLLNILLNACGFDFANPSQSVIVNFDCYRVLVLNFDLFWKSASFEFLLSHVHSLVETSHYKQHNLLQIKKTNFLKRLFHFLKSTNVKDDLLSQSFGNNLRRLISTILPAEATAESISLMSSYIVFTIYNPGSSKICGNAALMALTDFICDPATPIKALKKFSRSITIHWINLLFMSDLESVVCCGVRLLTRLLKILGKHVVHRFFSQNHGLDMLSSSLETWWTSRRVLKSLLLASFGDSRSLDQGSSLPAEGMMKEIQIPEFLLLLNELELNAMYTLSTNFGMAVGSNPSTPVKSSIEEIASLSFDVLHSLTMFCDWLEELNILSKMEKIPQFSDGLIRVLGYLKLSLTWFSDEATKSGFAQLCQRLSDLLTQFYISILRCNRFSSDFDNLNDLSKLVLLNYIFPKIFAHFKEFMAVSNFIYDEAEFSKSLATLLVTFYHEFSGRNFLVATQDLQDHLTCQVVLLEKNQSKEVKKLEAISAETIFLLILQIACESDYAFASSAEQLTVLLKELLYRQMSVFDKNVLGPDRLVPIIKLVFGLILTDDAEDGHISKEVTFSFLRAAYLRWMDEFPMIVQNLNFDTSLMNEFFMNLMTRDDNETLSKLKKYPPLVKSILRDYSALKQDHLRTERTRVSSIVKVSLHSGAKLAQSNSIYVKSFEKDCQHLKRQIMKVERTKYNGAAQDKKENMAQCNQQYQSLKRETVRVFGSGGSESYTLDYIENDDRMRCKLAIEDLLSESEKLNYEVEVPLLQADVETDPSLATLPNSIDTIHLSNELLQSLFEDPRSSDEPSLTHGNGDDKAVVDDKNRRVSRSLFIGDKIVTIWNVCQINGLVPVESLLILGSSYLYIIENYFHGQDGNIVDVKDAPRDMRDPIMQLVNLQSSRVDLSNSSHRTKSWGLDKLSCISKRQFLLRDNALEMFFSDGSNILITCLTSKESGQVYNKLSRFATGKDMDPDLVQALVSNSNVSHNDSISSKLVSALSNSSLNSFLHLSATKRWKMGEISNFYYLMIINTLAGRTFNDLTQYPVFPWVIADYTSEELDLSNPKTFRDLSKPMGAQTPGRANQFRERFEALDSLNDPDSPPFHYGTHYSSAMIVTSYLIRLKPYVQSYLLLQGGKFDHADRLFNSIEKAWLSASRDNTTDVRELIPEFYYLPEFLVNSNNFDFGKLQNGDSCDNVKLPPWAKGDPKLFIAKNREALESPYVSANLHSWIDLVFGVKQSGPEAIDSLNVFHHYSYNGAIDLDNIEDDVQKRAVIGMINNFGQTPAKVFSRPHTMKDVLNLPSYYMTLANLSKAPALVFESKLKEPIAKLELSSRSSRRWVGRLKCVSCEDELLIRKSKQSNFANGSLIVNETTFTNMHSCDIVSLLQIGSKSFLTGAADGLVSVWKYQVTPQSSLDHVATLRGHFCSIKSMDYSRSFKTGISVDKDGVVILWDLIRFNCIKKFSSQTCSKCLAAISNDSGNIVIVRGNSSDGDQGLLNLYNINGGEFLSKTLDQFSGIAAITFGTANAPALSSTKSSTHRSHVYWSNEFVGIARSHSVEIWEVTQNSQIGWNMTLLLEIPIQDINGEITTVRLLKCSEIDNEDRLIRGTLKLVIGDSTGKVYVV
ncbi:BPH1 [Candida theae]|uniref:BPH1 n=1 Tax=Candida theae TaxID=1198502 RepID=A0AAD5FXI5_9ASCO|nr:BPH1 [Candida theae]KAI5955472.1 BPH1 [Candida theae]